jgi:hypothetical protein
MSSPGWDVTAPFDAARGVEHGDRLLERGFDRKLGPRPARRYPAFDHAP